MNMYKATVGAYRKGDYQTVEGYVENFVPMESDGTPEQFEIDGVKFEYSKLAIRPGYHEIESQGDLIRYNGQHLRIGYVCIGVSRENIIVYIEELP